MIIEPDFPDHWKTQMLIQLSNDHSSPLWVIRLWAHCQQRKTHEFNNFPAEAIKAVCRYTGPSNKLESLLTTTGFIRRSEEKLIVHQWNEYNAQLLANWENGKLGGRPKVEPKNKPNDNPSITHGLPMGNPTLTQREPIDRIDREDRDIGKSFSPCFKQRLNKIFGRRDTTAWSKKEELALKALSQSKDFDAELGEIETYYTSGSKYLRQDLQTLLNNWAGELDRARRATREITMEKPKIYNAI